MEGEETLAAIDRGIRAADEGWVISLAEGRPASGLMVPLLGCVLNEIRATVKVWLK